MLRFARAPSRATSSVRGGVRGCTAIKRSFAPINRRCESPPRARVAGCTCNFNAHVEQPFETFVVAFAFGFFRGSQIKNVNKQGGVRGVGNRPKAAHGSFCSTHSFFGCFDLLSFCFFVLFSYFFFPLCFGALSVWHVATADAASVAPAHALHSSQDIRYISRFHTGNPIGTWLCSISKLTILNFSFHLFFILFSIFCLNFFEFFKLFRFVCSLQKKNGSLLNISFDFLMFFSHFFFVFLFILFGNFKKKFNARCQFCL